MRLSRLGIGSVAVACVAVGVVPAQASAQSAGDTWHGCRSGWVCLYTNQQALNAEPSGPHTDYYDYGYRNLSNVVGRHWIVNNQTGGATVHLCKGYGGTKCLDSYVEARTASNYEFTPINSITLDRP